MRIRLRVIKRDLKELEEVKEKLTKTGKKQVSKKIKTATKKKNLSSY